MAKRIRNLAENRINAARSAVKMILVPAVVVGPNGERISTVVADPDADALKCVRQPKKGK